MKAASKDNRRKLLGSLFAEAAKRGISQDDLRNNIAPKHLGKRLSAASDFEINKLRNHITGYKPTWEKKYPASIQGLRDEIVDIAKARFGEDYERPLNALCRCFGVRHYRWLNVSHGVAVKKRLKELQAAGPYERPDDKG